MEGERVGGLGEAGVEAVLKHGAGALPRLLGRLEDHHQGPRPLVLHRGEAAGGADPGRHVRVVPARVHDAALDPGGAGGADLAREGEAGLLGDGERVHVGAQQQDRAGPVLHYRDDAGLADARGDLEAEFLRLGGELGGGLDLLHRQLGIGMEVAIQRHQRRHVLRHRVAKLLGFGGGGHGEEGQSGGKERAPHVRLSAGVVGTSSRMSIIDSKCG